MSTDFAKQFVSYVNASPSPFHAVDQARQRLLADNFEEIKEKQPWDLKPSGKYFFTRNKSTLVAFVVGGKFKSDSTRGFSIIGAHTDSPCLRVKPVSELNKQGYVSVGVECYGGGLWHTWFDRDLTVAGRAIIANGENFEHKLLHVQRPILRIPTLAIHLNREVNSEGFKFNTENHLAPVLATAVKSQLESTKQSGGNDRKSGVEGKHHSTFLKLLSEELSCSIENIVDFELCLADTQPSVIGGLEQEFIFSPRLDNLASSFSSLQALINFSRESKRYADDAQVRLIALFDHEEIGSQSAQGADSALMEATLRRITAASGDARETAFEEAVTRSFLISADMAHAVHPNYSDKHEENHRPKMHHGPVVKINSNQRYATNAVTATLLRKIAEKAKVPLQDFVVRNDSPCGSTIGPIVAAKLGMRTIDIGSPQLSMHSIREMCGVDDLLFSSQLFEQFFFEFSNLDSRLTVD